MLRNEAHKNGGSMLNSGKILAFASAIALFVTPLQAAKTYQVTGPIVELTDKTIVVQKGDERWELARDEKTKNQANLKVGQKVTIHYRMTAATIESKDSEPKSKKE